MIPAIKSELRKLFTVRSTYFFLVLAVAIECLFAFYATGVKAKSHDLHDPAMMASQVSAAIGLLETVVALVSVLILTHEYRYNTILYTLTSARNRTRVFVAKIVVVTLFSVCTILALAVLSPLLTLAGLHVGGHTLVPQTFPALSILGRAVFAGWGFSMLALTFAFIIRVQPGAVAAIFLIPGTAEQLLGLLLKKNQAYLPYSSLNAVLERGDISYVRAAIVASIYIIAGWLIAWTLFLRRDAS